MANHTSSDTPDVYKALQASHEATKRKILFEPKTPPISLRVFGQIGRLLVIAGVMMFGFGGMLSTVENDMMGLNIAGLSVIPAVVGFACLSAYHVAVAILDMRDMVRTRLEGGQ